MLVSNVHSSQLIRNCYLVHSTIWNSHFKTAKKTCQQKYSQESEHFNFKEFLLPMGIEHRELIINT